jgi:glycosyltransferase involved in cell wall biosynthesis
MVEAAYARARISIIPNAVDTERFLPVERKHSQEEGVRILCVARLIERKGQHLLLDATRRLTDRGCQGFRVVLAGEGDAMAALKAQAQHLRIGHMVDFLGYVPRDLVPQVYADADLFVLPSFNEGMSVATLEAMAAGLPLVTTRGSGLEELVKDNGLTFDWGEVDALTDALEQLLRNRAMRQEMGKRSRELSKRFSWHAVGEQYRALLYAGSGRQAG